MRKWIALIVAGIAGMGYAVFSLTGCYVPPISVDLHLQGITAFSEADVDVNTDRGDKARANLLGIQPYMLTEDYASEERFFAKLDGYLAAAKARGFIGEGTIVVWPEYIGTWLAAAEERREVYKAARLQNAMTIIVLRNFFSFLRWLPFAEAPDRIKGALFHMKGQRMAAIYEHVFASLAARYHVVMVAGSIVLPAPSVEADHIVVKNGPLYNTSAVFGPDGHLLLPLVRKVFPTQEELPFIHPGNLQDLPVFATPAGKLGVLICADSWYPAPYAELRQKNVELIVVPSFLATKDATQEPWHGYSGAATPQDVDPHDVGRLSESQAWLKYALLGRFRDSKARVGINVFLRGQLWDLNQDGNSYCATASGMRSVPSKPGAQILNLWLQPGR